MKLTLRSVTERCKNEGDAYELLEELRWHGRPVCPHCGSADERHYFLTPTNGSTRKTRTGSQSERRVWKCRDCRKQFTVTVGTIFHGSKVSLRTWLLVLVQAASAKNGISAREIERMHDVTPETAWHMMHRIREAMTRAPLVKMAPGTVVADETWIGGNPQNRHGYKAGRGGQGVTKKIPVLSLIHTETGEARSVAIPKVTGENLRRVMAEHTNMAETVLHTDEATSYRHFEKEMAGHETVNHREGEYARRGITTNQAEGFFSQLKRSLDGTHHHVSEEHLHRYLAEFDFRYTTRGMTDSERVEQIVDQSAGKRLSYNPLTGR